MVIMGRFLSSLQLGELRMGPQETFSSDPEPGAPVDAKVGCIL